MTIRITFSDKTVRVAVEINGQVESAIAELPQRTWQGLTDEEREFLLHQALRFYDTNAQLLSFIKTVEAKLKEKNT